LADTEPVMREIVSLVSSGLRRIPAGPVPRDGRFGL